VTAVLENKPIYIFDELAADQEPQFRQYFYEVVLNDLKKQGKTIIAVTHDDNYFHIADRVLKMEYGRLLPN
jgi:putative ATP-binding cassette transporter